MTLEDLFAQIRALPDEDYYRLSDEMYVIGREREARAQVEQAQAELVVELQEAHPELKPAATTTATPATTLEGLLGQLSPWAKPQTRAGAYPSASLVKHEGKAWRARRLTDKEPGVSFSGWEDVTADYLKLADAVDGNAPGVGTDAPGLITEPEPEPKPEPTVTPAPGVKPYKDGENLSKGEMRQYTDGHVYVWQKTVLEKTKPETAPDKGTGHWQKLD